MISSCLRTCNDKLNTLSVLVGAELMINDQFSFLEQARIIYKYSTRSWEENYIIRHNYMESSGNQLTIFLFGSHLIEITRHIQVLAVSMAVVCNFSLPLTLQLLFRNFVVRHSFLSLAILF